MAPLSYRDVPALLLGCLAFSSAFYGVYAWPTTCGACWRCRPDRSVSSPAYGAGFMLSGLLGARLIERLGPRRCRCWAPPLWSTWRCCPPRGRCRPCCSSPPSGARLCLNLLVLLLSRARPEERGAVLGLNTCVTYLGASLGTAVAGTLYTHAGFATLALSASGAVAVAALGLHWRLNARARRAFKAAPKPAPAPDAPSLQARRPAGFFRPGRLCCRCARLRDIAAPITIKEDRVTATTPRRRRPTDPFRHLPGGHPQPRPGRRGRRARLCADIAGLTRSVGVRAADDTLSCVMGIGSQAWDRLFGAPRPKELHPFREINGVHHAPATPGDLLFHLRAERMDLCFELSTLIMARLEGAVTVADTAQGFVFRRPRPARLRRRHGNPVAQAARDATLIGDEDEAFKGGSYVIVQKYLHDMKKWDEIPVEQQEKIIGRKKLSNVELDDAAKPSYAHNVLTVIEKDGEEQPILRDNMPFGDAGKGEFGTYFIGYARSPSRIERMLDNMFLGNPPGNYDRLLDVSRAVTGSLYFSRRRISWKTPNKPTRRAWSLVRFGPCSAAANLRERRALPHSHLRCGCRR